jgi:hypothetical protein
LPCLSEISVPQRFRLGREQFRLQAIRRKLKNVWDIPYSKKLSIGFAVHISAANMKGAFTKELIWSAVFAGIGLAFLYYAAFGTDRNVLHLVFLNVGCGLSSFALAIQPQALFERVVSEGFRLRLPRAGGIAGVLNFLSLIFLGLAAIAWLASL